MNSPLVQVIEEQERFDEFDDALMNDICGPTLAKPVQDLLITLRQIEMIQGSFGDQCVNPSALSVLIGELKALREACKELHRDA